MKTCLGSAREINFACYIVECCSKQRVELYAGYRSAKLRAGACISSGARWILKCGEKKHAIELPGTILSVTDCGIFMVQMDVNI